jgi:hypothetical protein
VTSDAPPKIGMSTADCRNLRFAARSPLSTSLQGNMVDLSEPNNLALACWNCNLKKGPNLSGVDPNTGQVVALFHPRQDEWDEDFSAVIGAHSPLA